MADWRSTTVDNGEQCVRTASAYMKQWWLVASWVSEVTNFMGL